MNNYWLVCSNQWNNSTVTEVQQQRQFSYVPKTIVEPSLSYVFGISSLRYVLSTPSSIIVDLRCQVSSSTTRSSTQVHIAGFHFRLTPLGCRFNRWLTWSGSFYGLPWSKGLFHPFVCHSLQPPLQANFSMPSQFEDQKRLFEARHAGYILFWSAAWGFDRCQKIKQ